MGTSLQTVSSWGRGNLSGMLPWKDVWKWLHHGSGHRYGRACGAASCLNWGVFCSGSVFVAWTTSLRTWEIHFPSFHVDLWEELKVIAMGSLWSTTTYSWEIKAIFGGKAHHCAQGAERFGLTQHLSGSSEIRWEKDHLLESQQLSILNFSVRGIFCSNFLYFSC